MSKKYQIPYKIVSTTATDDMRKIRPINNMLIMSEDYPQWFVKLANKSKWLCKILNNRKLRK